MHGNVWEWCEDRWHDDYSEAGRPDDGAAWTRGDSTLRVLRGGSWLSGDECLRCSHRIGLPHGYRNVINGFRLARSTGARAKGSKGPPP